MQRTYPPSRDVQENALITADQYERLYQESLENPEAFWAQQAKRLDWMRFPQIIKNASFEGDVSIKWYEDGTLNACYNCVDRHVVAGHGAETALIFEGDDPTISHTVTYAQLQEEVAKVANGLRSLGIQKGDRVMIYMPMICEAVYAMLACARIGAIHSVVFGGFSADSLRRRIEDCGAKLVITADAAIRGGRLIPLKKNVDAAIAGTTIETVMVLNYQGTEMTWDAARDKDWEDVCGGQSPHCPCVEMYAEDPLFILYTSGSTGSPKGVLHTTGGYLVYAAMTHEYVFDYKPGDIYWCTADVGWITGHSYIVYGPLANRATTLIFEGVPHYPDYSRFWQVVDKHRVTIFYTAPTAIRALLCAGDQWVTPTDRSSLRLLGTVGEPINDEAWLWYYNTVGQGRCPIMDTWWQTETGGHLITPLACHALKPGKAQKPFFGIQPALVDNDGNIIPPNPDGSTTAGNLCILESWPGQMRSLWGDHKRFIQTYFAPFPGKYFSGDGARRDQDGDFRITGRVDDVINVSGHRLGTSEIEEAINQHPAVAESAVVGFPHNIKGQGLYGYVILTEGQHPSPALETAINQTLRKIIGPIAKLDMIHFTKGLPKTRSGKIMRRILRKIAAHETDQLGDIATLANPDVVADLIKTRA